MSKVFIKIPKSGLGNMLLVWAYGIVFSEINNLPVTVSKWRGLRWGALIRRENKNRLYYGYFKEESSFKILKTRICSVLKPRFYNPALKVLENKSDSIFIFNKLPSNNYFISLAPYEAVIKTRLNDLLSEKVKKELNCYQVPEIGIHIRRGDFKVANHITPVVYFIEIIEVIRQTYQKELSVTVFTDADTHEIKDIFKLKNVYLHKAKYDITDILLLSKSKILILSRDSSFSYWGAFLSNAFIIMHSGDWQKRIKNDSNSYTEFRYSIGQAQKLENCIKHTMVRNTIDN